MAKQSYILNLPLKTEAWQEHRLFKRLEMARNIYNGCLGEVLKRYKRLKQDKGFKYWIKQTKSKERTQALKQLNKGYELSEYSLHAFVKPMQHHFKKNIDAHTSQKIATRAWKTFEKFMYDKNAKKVHFKRKGELESVEGKTNKSGIRYMDEHIHWNGLIIPVVIKDHDEYAHIALLDKIKYCRMVRKVIRGKDRYFVQFVLDGVPPKKMDKATGPFKQPHNEGKVGLDIGTQTIAVVSKDEAKLLELAPNINNIEREKRILLRKLDRQRRANNPHKYNPDGTIKRTKEKWMISNNYLNTKRQLAERQRKIADIRKQDHNRMANWILSLGDDIKVETMNYKGLQARAKQTTVNKKTGRIHRKKRFGKSLANKAPSMLLTILDNKLKYEGKELQEIDTYKVKASQYNHFDHSYVKKPVSKRWNEFECGKVQRDLYSGYLIMNVKDNLKEIDRERCVEYWAIFKELHNKEIERLKQTKTLASMGL
ncbi:RNA-guided endonuclease TnpB family protein [Alkalihalobacterium alkalinitrilicum]|uniref:RNA-guided endonuclease TnpB family protein n=1 Tax=Alkalihalobacterium alkalinitrilicum TaxID=427920 RepID=UPI000995A5B6|nr:RNA-guided endonuclease TnpB family protein [Alkalihalobacterium alkalinitrilicum]